MFRLTKPVSPRIATSWRSRCGARAPVAADGSIRLVALLASHLSSRRRLEHLQHCAHIARTHHPHGTPPKGQNYAFRVLYDGPHQSTAEGRFAQNAAIGRTRIGSRKAEIWSAALKSIKDRRAVWS